MTQIAAKTPTNRNATPSNRVATTGTETVYDNSSNSITRDARQATSIENVAHILDAKGGNPEYTARCPAHNDNVESLSFRQGDKGIVYTCHAGCDFVRDLVPSLKARGIESTGGQARRFVEKEYDYVDSVGELLCQKVRYFPKDFRQRRPDGRGGWIWNLDGVARVLYNLPAVEAAIRSKDDIYLVEGEKDADAVSALGLCGTTYIDGASKSKSKWRPEYTQQLAGSSVVYVLPDSDEAGLNQGRLIVQELTKYGISCKLVELPGEKDVSDWLLLGKGRDDLVTLCKQTAEKITAPNQNHESTAQTDELIKIGESYELIRTASHNSYAEIEGRLHELESEHVKNTLILQFYEKTRRVPSSDAVAKAVSLLKARVLRLPVTKTFLRVGEFEGSIYLDLADDMQRVIEIDEHGWRIAPTCPIKFLRPSSMLALPYPDERGKLDPLAELIRARDEELILLQAMLLQYLRPTGPYPLAGLSGAPGATKSSCAKIMKGFIDPAVPLLQSLPSNDRDFAVTCHNAHVLVFDNISKLSGEDSDRLCKAATGGGYTGRSLYSNDQQASFEFARPIILTGIGDYITRSDLLDRTIPIALPVIKKSDRISEAVLKSQIEHSKPVVLGGLLTALSSALRELPNVHLASKPRMADFVELGTAAESSLGLRSGEFAECFDANHKIGDEMAIEGSLFASTVRQYIDEHSDLKGSATFILSMLETKLSEKEKRHPNWPNKQTFKEELDRCAQNLESVGISFDYIRTATQRTYTIYSSSENRDAA